MESCRASCSMPLAAPIVEIDSIAYVDGSASNSIPQIGLKKKKVIL